MPRLGITKANLISRGAARFHDLLYLALRDRKLVRRELAHTRLGAIDQGELAGLEVMNWHAVALCVTALPTPKLLAISADGVVRAFGGGQEFDERIPDAFDIRGCSAVEGSAYAFGMGRQVFVRSGEGTWTPMHAPESSDDVVGFECLSGFSGDDLYAAGWEGEIWHHGENGWTDCDSPVNAVLSGICCAPDGKVYACGQQGTLLRGRRDEWECLVTPDLEDDLWDIRWFDGKLYIASMSYLYWLDGDRMVPVEFDIDAPSSFYKLTDADGVLWSVGQEAILSFDGKHWERWD